MNTQRTGEQPTGTDAPERGQGGMYVEESGSPGAPAIVFIHGAGQSHRIWGEHMERLTAFHCLAPDLPGFGRSVLADRFAVLPCGQPARHFSEETGRVAGRHGLRGLAYQFVAPL